MVYQDQSFEVERHRARENGLRNAMMALRRGGTRKRSLSDGDDHPRLLEVRDTTNICACCRIESGSEARVLVAAGVSGIA